MSLNIRVKQTTPGVVTLLPLGNINQDTYEKLDSEINRVLSEPVNTLVFDMAGVEFISSAGIGVIAKAKTTMVKKGCDIAMINLQPQVQKVFEIIRLLPTLNVFESVKELDEYLVKIQNRIIDEGSSIGSQ